MLKSRLAIEVDAVLHADARGHDLYIEFIEKCFDTETPYRDMVFIAGRSSIPVHSFILAARCPKLGKSHQRCVSNSATWWASAMRFGSCTCQGDKGASDDDFASCCHLCT